NRRARGIARGDADFDERIDSLRAARDAERAERRRRTPQQFLESDVLVRELQRLDQVILVRVAVDAQEADRAGDGRLRAPRGRALQARQDLDRALVPDLAERDRRIHLQRAIEL